MTMIDVSTDPEHGQYWANKYKTVWSDADGSMFGYVTWQNVCHWSGGVPLVLHDTANVTLPDGRMLDDVLAENAQYHTVISSCATLSAQMFVERLAWLDKANPGSRPKLEEMRAIIDAALNGPVP